MRRSAIALMALSLVLAGCFWPVPGQNADRTAYNDLEDTISPGNVAGLQQVWTWSAGGAYALYGPVVSTGGVHVEAPLPCKLHTLDPATGALRWTGELKLASLSQCFRFPGGTSVWSGPPFVVGDNVYAGVIRYADIAGEPRRLHWTRGFDVATGAQTSETREGAIVAYRDGVGIGADTGTSEIPWINRGSLGAATWSSTGIRQDAEGHVTLAAGAGVLYDTGPGPLSTTPGVPASGWGIRAYSLTESHPGCILTAGGPPEECPLWATPTDHQAGTQREAVLDPDGTRLYLGASTGTFSAYDTATGAVAWTATAGTEVTQAPALASDRLYVPTATGLTVLDATDGTVLWTASTPSRISQQPAVAGGVVFTASPDGMLHAFDAAGCGSATCPPLWSTSTGAAAINGAPIVSQGRLIIATADGRVVAYGLP